MNLKPLSAAVMGVTVGSPGLLLAAGRDRCGTRSLDESEAAQVERQIEDFQKGRGEGPGTLAIPVWVHVINKGPGFENGDVPDTNRQ